MSHSQIYAGHPHLADLQESFFLRNDLKHNSIVKKPV